MKFEFFSDMFSKNTEIRNFMKIRPVTAEFFHADRGTGGQMNMTGLIELFLQFCEQVERNDNPSESI